MNTTTTTPIEIIAIRETVENSYAKWDRYVWKRDSGTGASEEWDDVERAIDAAQELQAQLSTLLSCARALDSQVLPGESDYIATGVIDPDGVADTAIELTEWPASQGWDCAEKMIAYRHGDALYIWWCRKVWGNRNARDVWVLVDENYFA
jgi:hypothetical protein